MEWIGFMGCVVFIFLEFPIAYMLRKTCRTLYWSLMLFVPTLENWMINFHAILQNNSIKFISVKLFINKLPIDFRQLSLILFEKKLKRFLLKSCFYSIDWFLASNPYYVCPKLWYYFCYHTNLFLFVTSSFFLILHVRIIHWLWWLKYFCSRTNCFYSIFTFFSVSSIIYR